MSCTPSPKMKSKPPMKPTSEPGVCPVSKSRVSRSISPLPALTLQLNVPNGTDSLIVLKGDKPWKLRSIRLREDMVWIKIRVMAVVAITGPPAGIDGKLRQVGEPMSDLGWIDSRRGATH